MDLQDIHDRQERYWDSMVAGFEEHLRRVIAQAQARMAGYLAQNLVLDADGRIARVAGNYRIVRNLDSRFMEFLDDAGYKSLINGFVQSFPSQQAFLQDTLEYLSESSKVPLKMEFTAADLKAFAGFRLNAVSSLEAVAETAARTAMQQALFSIAGLKFSDLVGALAEKMNASVPRATMLGESAVTTFYRVMADTNFLRIEEGFGELKYRYSGPLDKRNRPFCRHLLIVDLAYTRALIMEMDNGQLPNPMLSCGGFGCRHQFVADVRSLEQRAAAA